jgi:hypothetical protein
LTELFDELEEGVEGGVGAARYDGLCSTGSEVWAKLVKDLYRGWPKSSSSSSSIVSIAEMWRALAS